MTTKNDAEIYVVTCIESNGTATRHDFDVPGILEHISYLIGDAHPQTLVPKVFWEIVACHAIDTRKV